MKSLCNLTMHCIANFILFFEINLIAFYHVFLNIKNWNLAFFCFFFFNWVKKSSGLLSSVGIRTLWLTVTDPKVVALRLTNSRGFICVQQAKGAATKCRI